MESKEYFEKIMQDYNQNGKGRSLLNSLHFSPIWIILLEKR